MIYGIIQTVIISKNKVATLSQQLTWSHFALFMEKDKMSLYLFYRDPYVLDFSD